MVGEALLDVANRGWEENYAFGETVLEKFRVLIAPFHLRFADIEYEFADDTEELHIPRRRIKTGRSRYAEKVKKHFLRDKELQQVPRDLKSWSNIDFAELGTRMNEFVEWIKQAELYSGLLHVLIDYLEIARVFRYCMVAR